MTNKRSPIFATSASDPLPDASAADPPTSQLDAAASHAELLRRLAEEGADLEPALQRQTGAVVKALAQELGVLREQLKRTSAEPDWETRLRQSNEMRARLAERIKRIAAGLRAEGETK